MGRTAVNVSGSMTAGTVTSKLLGQTDFAIFNATDAVPAAVLVGRARARAVSAVRP